MKTSVPLYMISDSVGETSLKIVNAADFSSLQSILICLIVFRLQKMKKN